MLVSAGGWLKSAIEVFGGEFSCVDVVSITFVGVLCVFGEFTLSLSSGFKTCELFCSIMGSVESGSLPQGARSLRETVHSLPLDILTYAY